MYFILSLILLTASSLVLLYLSLRSYAMKSDDSVVNLCPTGSEIWNCDAALTSPFAEVFGVPISGFGMATSLFCVLILVLLHFNLLEKSISWSRWVWRIALASASASIVMFAISWLFLESFCFLCTVCYVLFFLVLFPLRKTLPSTQLIDYSILFSFKKWKAPLSIMARVIVSVLFIHFLFHAWSSNVYNIKDKSSQSTSNFRDWKNKKEILIEKNVPRVSYGPEQATMVITEFADFLCPHCRRVYSVIKTFQQVRPDAKLEYINFPLDPRGCRKGDDMKTTSASCYLAKAVLCAYEQKLSDPLKELVFSQQNFFIKNRNQVEKIQEKVLQNPSLTSMDQELFNTCVLSSSTQDKVAQQIQAGKKLGIRGTPALFINQRKVRPVAVHLTLDKIYQSLSNR